jgi:hypothetical protein
MNHLVYNVADFVVLGAITITLTVGATLMLGLVTLLSKRRREGALAVLSELGLRETVRRMLFEPEDRGPLEDDHKGTEVPRRA